MEKQSPNREEKIEIERALHSSVNVFSAKKNRSIDEHKKYFKKRSSSMLLNYTKNFVPKLKPIKAIISPSPINLNQKYPESIPQIQNVTISTISLDSQNDSNSKPIKYIYSRKNIPKRSSKILNIEEESHAISDCENESKKDFIIYSDSDSSKSDKESDNNLNIIYKSNNSKISYFPYSIKIMRKRMAKIRNSFRSNDNLLDDSNIENFFMGKRLNHFKSINQQNLISTIRKKKFLNLKKIKYRTKSFNIKQRYVSTILGFLEKNNSSNSLNSNGK